MHSFFGMASGVVGIIAWVPYLRDVMRGKTKPERASFWIWGVLGVIIFSSQWAAGASWSLLLPAMDTIGIVIIALLAVKRGVGGFTRRDLVALGAAGVGLVLWYLTSE